MFLLSRVQEIWSIIPSHLRGAFYAQPLFVQWWFALYLEKDDKLKKVSHLAFFYFVVFLIQTFITHMLYLLASYLSIGDQISNFYYFAFGLQVIWALLYIFLSLLLSYETLRGVELFFHYFRIDCPSKVMSWLEVTIGKEQV